MDPTKIEPDQDSGVPVSTTPLGAERGSIAIDTSNPVVERIPGVEPSYPEVHETAGGFIKPNPSAQAPVAEIKRALDDLVVPPPEITGHLNITPARAEQLQEGPIESGRTWLGFLVTKLNKVAALFRKKQPVDQLI